MTDHHPPVTRYEISTKLGRYTYVLAEEHAAEVARMSLKLKEALDNPDSVYWHQKAEHAERELARLEARLKELEAEVNLLRAGHCKDVWEEERDALTAKLAEAENTLEKERWQHAACLTIAEGGPGWSGETWAESEAIRAVRNLYSTASQMRERERRLRKWIAECLEWMLCVGDKGHCDFCDCDGGQHETDCLGREGQALLLNAEQALRDIPT